MPTVGQTITINLPDERTRADVIKVISNTACLVKIAQFTTSSKSHPYHKDDVVAVQLRKDGMGQQAWIAIDERPTAPSAETIASLSDAEEEEEPEDAVDSRELQGTPQPSSKRASSKKGSSTGKRHSAERRP
jgi:hypothetical protein